MTPHEQALEAALKVFDEGRYLSHTLQFSDAITAYLAARNCVLMPREIDTGLLNVMYGAEDDYAKDGEGQVDERRYAALIAEMDRRNGGVG